MWLHYIGFLMHGRWHNVGHPHHTVITSPDAEKYGKGVGLREVIWEDPTFYVLPWQLDRGSL